MQTFIFESHGGKRATVKAVSEDDARRKAMIEIWGPAPCNAVPYAPNYTGVGLSLVRFAF